MTATFEEESKAPRIEQLDLSHLSIELGHLYMEDYERGFDHLVQHFRQVAPWVDTAKNMVGTALKGRTPRISTCFLVDDYFTRFSSPAEVIPQLKDAAAESGLRIDYLMRESACARAGDLELAHLVESGLVDDPPPNTTGARPPARTSGWLCNGQRTPSTEVVAALEEPPQWSPPAQNGAVNHSIFVDVEIWRDHRAQRLWSCPFLAAVWQLLRLGMLRNEGQPVVVAKACPEVLPDSWAGLAPLTRLESGEGVQPFAAYRTFSVLAPRFAIIEVAVRAILSQFVPTAEVAAFASRRSSAESIFLPTEVVDRIEYTFASAPWFSAGLAQRRPRTGHGSARRRPPTAG